MPPSEAWTLLKAEFEAEGHGGEHHDEDCPICNAIEVVDAFMERRDVG